MKTIEYFNLLSVEIFQENEMLQVLGGHSEESVPVDQNADKCNKCDKCDKCTWFCG